MNRYNNAYKISAKQIQQYVISINIIWALHEESKVVLILRINKFYVF